MLAALLLVSAVVAGGAYLCGMTVGRRVERERAMELAHDVAQAERRRAAAAGVGSRMARYHDGAAWGATLVGQALEHHAP